MKNLLKSLYQFFLLDLLNFAPGTWGSLISIFILFILFKFLSLSQFFPNYYLFILFFISNYLINNYSLLTNSYDSKNIVIDEFLGIFTIFFFMI